jgi:hypothetical protein
MSDKPILHYKLYGQDGQLIDMTCADTPDMRRFVEWVRKHDRYTVAGEDEPPPSVAA